MTEARLDNAIDEASHAAFETLVLHGVTLAQEDLFLINDFLSDLARSSGQIESHEGVV